MNENQELVNEEETEELDVDVEDDSDEYVKAKTFPIDENWPEELKKQVEQLNKMSEMINSEVDTSDDDESENEEESLDDEEEEEEEAPVVSTEETETFNDVF